MNHPDDKNKDISTGLNTEGKSKSSGSKKEKPIALAKFEFGIKCI
jgi:hypothetical protein